jgi:hypothetical protein
MEDIFLGRESDLNISIGIETKFDSLKFAVSQKIVTFSRYFCENK